MAGESARVSLGSRRIFSVQRGGNCSSYILFVGNIWDDFIMTI